jgi:hypothetical protein
LQARGQSPIWDTFLSVNTFSLLIQADARLGEGAIQPFFRAT